jgi:hypothetical protein
MERFSLDAATARDQAVLAYDAATQKTILFGSSIDSFSQSDAWSWNGSIWIQVN